jgi:ubiquinone/menaquinone biosynthesis C-methylase UbiE
MLPRMLPRVLEAEVMDTIEDAEEYDAMDFTASNRAFAEAAIALVGDAPRPRVLDLGTGTAQIPLLLLEMHPRATVVAVDLSGPMIEVAARRARSSPHRDRLELVLGDAKSEAPGSGTFDLVMSNSVAHHIPDPTVLFRQLARAARPGGAVLVRDLFRPASHEEAWAVVNRVSPNDSDKQKRLFFDSLCAALTPDEVREMAARAGLGDARVPTVSDRHWSLERALRRSSDER